jgi:hypothetical protein
VLLLVTGSGTLIACGSGSGNKNIDAKGSDSKADANASCALPATVTTPTFGGSSCTTAAGTECAVTYGSGSGYTQDLEWQGTIGGTGSGAQFFSLDIFGGGGSSSTPDWPTNLSPASDLTFSATAPDFSLLLGTDANSSGQAAVLYAATAGTLNVTAASVTIGSTFSGNFSNLTLQHYDIPTNGNPTPDPDGCMTRVAGPVDFSAPVQSPPTSGGIRPNPPGSVLHITSAAK